MESLVPDKSVSTDKEKLEYLGELTRDFLGAPRWFWVLLLILYVIYAFIFKDG